MTQQLKTFIDIQFSQTYEPDKARRLVEEIKRIEQTLNSIIKELNSLQVTGGSTLVPHELVGHFHTVSGLQQGQVLKANSDATFGFSRLSFAELAGVDSLTFAAPAQGDIIQYLDGYYSLVSSASLVGAPADGEYLLGIDNSGLPNGRVVADSLTISWDTSVSGEVALNITPGSIDNTHLKTTYARTLMLMGA